MKRIQYLHRWKLSITLLMSCGYFISFAQVERQVANHWFFGNYYGLNFSSGNPVVDNSSSMLTYESSTTVSDKEGNLLFYTNGGGRLDSTVLGYIWNRNHEVMDGGALGIDQGGGYSAAQGAISVLRPGTMDQYYLFTIDEVETITTEGNTFVEGKGLSVFEIDMSANGGLGKVTLANEKLLTPAFEHLSITKHGNCEDFWLIAKTGHAILANDLSVVDSFYTFKISENGIEAPIITPIANELTNTDWALYMLRFSPDGTHFLNGPFLYDFDKNTGTIGSLINLEVVIGVDPPYALSFSPDGRLIHYFSLFNQGQQTVPTVKFFGIQYDIETMGLTFSSEVAFPVDEAPLSNLIGTPQLAPNGKLYIPLHHGIAEEPTRIYVMDFPNEKGASTQFYGPVLSLSPPMNDPFLRFGNYPDYLFYYNKNEEIVLDLPDEIILDCQEVTPILLSSSESFDCILWSTGEISETIQVESEGTYWLEVADACAVGRDTVDIVFENTLFDIDLGNDTSICEGEEVYFTIDFIPDADYTWQDGSVSPLYHADEDGLYWLEVQAGDCYDQDSIDIEVIPLPVVDVGNDTIVCVENEFILDASHPNNISYEWENGSTDAIFEIESIGFYSVTATNSCGQIADTIFVNLEDCEACLIEFPNAFTPNNDQISDSFGSSSDCVFIKYQLRIFNRWGEIVYTGNEESENWDGTLRGKLAPEDTYIYMLEYETINVLGQTRKDILSGDLTLIR